MPDERLNLTIRIELANGSVHEHIFEVTPEEFRKMDRKEFFDLFEAEGVALMQVHSPLAYYNLNHVARWGIAFEGAPELGNAIKEMGFLARER